MIKLIYLICLASLVQTLQAQNLAYAPHLNEVKLETKRRDDKPKPISYTALGYLAPLNMHDIIIGGTTTVYKRFGTFLAYKVGINNWLLPNGEKGDLTYDNIKSNGWSANLTGNSERAVTFMLSGGLSFAIWKKMPIYVGLGATRYREFFEYIDPVDNKPKWNVNPDKSGFQINYTAGFMLPLFSRVLLNIGYDHNPQSIFIGIGISGIYAYEDIDEWD